MTKQRIEYEGYYVEKERNTITFGYSWNGSDRPRLLIDLNPDNSISLNQEWLIKEQELDQRWESWRSFLKQIGLAGGLSARKLAMPPIYVRTDEDRWEYLRQIAAGRVHIYNCGKKCREKLARFLAEQGRPLPG